MTAIVAGDVKYYLSAPGASAGNTVAGTVGNSRGNYISTSQISGTPLDNIFTDLTGAQNAASQVDYQCLFILNDTASGNTMLNTTVWISSQISGGAVAAIGLDTTAVSVRGTSSAQALTIANVLAAPVAVSFSAAASSGAALSIGSIPAGSVKAVWIRRTAANTVPVNNDGLDLQVDFDTMA